MSILAFVKRFHSFHYPPRYGVAVYVRARNCREHQTKWLTGPMTYSQAVECAEQIARKKLRVGSMVSLPAARHGEYTGTIGTIAGQVYIQSPGALPVCPVHIGTEGGPTLVFPVSDLQPALVHNAIKELIGQWGYRDITELVRRVQEQLDAMEEGNITGIDSLCVLQEPDGSLIYCQNKRSVLLELDEARTRGRYYKQCPAPDPKMFLWMVIGNFESDEPEEEEEV